MKPNFCSECGTKLSAIADEINRKYTCPVYTCQACGKETLEFIPHNHTVDTCIAIGDEDHDDDDRRAYREEFNERPRPSEY